MELKENYARTKSLNKSDKIKNINQKANIIFIEKQIKCPYKL